MGPAAGEDRRAGHPVPSSQSVNFSSGGNLMGDFFGSEAGRKNEGVGVDGVVNEVTYVELN